MIEDSDIEVILTQNEFSLYQKFKKINLLNRDPNTKWCPSLNCEKFVKLTESNKKNDYLICDCGLKICIKCGREWHGKRFYIFNISCEEFINKEYEAWAQGKPVQSCPNCQTRVEKEEGCNHITCRFLYSKGILYLNH